MPPQSFRSAGNQLKNVTIQTDNTNLELQDPLHVRNLTTNIGTTLNAANHNIEVISNLNLSGNYSADPAQVISITGTANLSATPSISCLTVENGATVNLNSELTLLGNFINSGTFNTNDNNIKVAGDVDFTDGIYTYTAGSGIFTLNGGANQSLTSDGNSLDNVSITNGTNLSLQDALEVESLSSIVGSTLNASTHNITSNGNLSILGSYLADPAQVIYITGTANLSATPSISCLTVENGATVNLNSELTLLGNFINSGTFNTNDKNIKVAGDVDFTDGIYTYTAGSGNFTLNGGANQNLTSDGNSLDNVSITNGTNLSLQDELEVASLTSATNTTLTAGSNNIKSSGSVAIAGDYSANPAQMLTMTGTGNLSATPSIACLTVENGANVSLTSELTLLGNFINSGAFSTNNNDINVAGNVNFTGGTYTAGNGTLIFNGDGTEQSLTSAQNNLGILEMESSANLSLQDALEVESLSSIVGSTLNASTHNITSNGDIDIAGTFSANASHLIEMTGAGNLHSASPIKNLTVNAGGNVVTLTTSSLTLEENLSITSGTLNANGQDISIAGNWDNNGSFTHGNAKVGFTGATESTITGETSFYNFECTEPNKTLNFEAGKTQTIDTGGSITINGQNTGTEIVLQSTDSGNDTWFLGLSNLTYTSGTDPINISYATIKDSDLYHSDANNNFVIELVNGINGGNNDRFDNSVNLFGQDNALWKFDPVTYTWNGDSTTTNWYDGDNWDKDEYPASYDEALIPAKPNLPVAENDIIIDSLTLEEATSSLTMAGFSLNVTTSYTANNPDARLRLQGDEANIALNTSPIPGTVEYCGNGDAVTNTYTSLVAGTNYTNLIFSNKTGTPDAWQLTNNNITINNNFILKEGISLTDTGTGSFNITSTASFESGAGTSNIAFVVGGLTTIDVGSSNDIALTADNNFSTLTVTSGNNINIKDVDTINLEAVDLENNLTVDANPINITEDITSNGGEILLISPIINQGANISTASSNITIDGELVLTGNAERKIINPNGNITFNSTINSDGDSDESLSLSAGAGTIDFKDEVGGTEAPQYLLVLSASGLTNSVTTEINMANTDLYIDASSSNLSIQKDLRVNNFYFYNGSLDLGTNNISLTTAKDFATFGFAFSPDDPDGVADNKKYDYPKSNTLSYYPKGGEYKSTTRSFSVVPGATFSDLSGASITVGENFYVNGSNMVAANDWNLNINDNSSVTNLDYQASGWPFGDNYATAFNMTVSHSIANNYVTAASSANSNNVTNGGDNLKWDFGSPTIASAQTVNDKVVKIVFSDTIENSNNEIQEAVLAGAGKTVNDCGLWLSDGKVDFTGAFIDADCTTPTTGQGDLSEFYLKVLDESWNTDATGSSAGDEKSTNSLGIAKNYTGMANPVIPNISFIKGVLFNADGHNQINAYIDATKYTATTDACSPVLVNVVAGRAEHREETGDYVYDAHNYLHLRYSEPVTIGNLDTDSANMRTQETFSANTEHGGAIKRIDTNNFVEITGFIKYGDGSSVRKLPIGSIDNNPGSTIYRDSTNGENPSGEHGLTLYVAGYRTDASSPWAAYIGDPSLTIEDYLRKYNITLDGNAEESYLNPVGAPVEVLANNFITDQSGNAIKGSSGVLTVEALGANNSFGDANIGLAMPTDDLPAWDIDPPFFSQYIDSDAPPTTFVNYEIISRDIDNSGTLDFLDFFIRDNIDAQNNWISDGAGDLHIDENPYHGLRDSSLTNNPAWRSSIKLKSATSDSLTDEYNSGISTDTENVIFAKNDGTFAQKTNDSYFSIFLENAPWSAEKALKLQYIAQNGLFTDLAGNLIPSTAEDLLCFSMGCPNIELTLASAGDNKIYVRFTEPVVDISGSAIDATNFNFSPPGVSIASIVPITQENGGITEAWFNLSDKLSADDVFSGLLSSVENKVISLIGAIMPADATHKASDVGLGLMIPVWAKPYDGEYSASGGGDDILRDFDGTGDVGNGSITIEATILSDAYKDLTAFMYFDVEPDASVMQDGYWLPVEDPLMVPVANTEARKLEPIRVKNSIRDFVIPADDAEIENGADVQFIFQLGDFYCARLTDKEDPRSLTPWQFGITGMVEQAAGVTILNNVINPEKGEKTIINFKLKTSGFVVINVFNLSGDLVDVIQKGEQAPGTYTYTWDGKNRAGNNVGRGVYFIRVVAPEIDEYRKVMIVK